MLRSEEWAPRALHLPLTQCHGASAARHVPPGSCRGARWTKLLPWAVVPWSWGLGCPLAQVTDPKTHSGICSPGWRQEGGPERVEQTGALAKEEEGRWTRRQRQRTRRQMGGGGRPPSGLCCGHTLTLSSSASALSGRQPSGHPHPACPFSFHDLTTCP